MRVFENSKIIDWGLWDSKYKFLLVMETTREVKTTHGNMPQSEFSWLLERDPRRDGNIVIDGHVSCMGGFGFGNGHISINEEVDYIQPLELHIKPAIQVKNEIKKEEFA